MNPEVEKLDSRFRPKGQYIAFVGLNPEVKKLYSGFRPKGQYIAFVDLNPEVKKMYLGFRPKPSYNLHISTHSGQGVFDPFVTTGLANILNFWGVLDVDTCDQI